MFNAGYKKEALAGLKRAAENHKTTYDSTVYSAQQLYQSRVSAVEFIKKVEGLVNSIANTPKEFVQIIAEIKLNRQNFEAQVHNLELQSKKADAVSGSVAGAGVVAGIGVAALGPAAAIGIATTFGVASTGTAIAALVGGSNERGSCLVGVWRLSGRR
jgi:hypothetical protein